MRRKRLVKAVVVILLAIVMSPVALIGVLALLNFRTASETDLRQSALLQSPPAPLAEPVTLRVVTFNLHDLYLVSTDRPARMRGVGEALAELDPDLAGLQEAFIASDRRVLLDTLRAKGSRLVHSRYFPSATVGSGLMILSAYPLAECFFHRYPKNGRWHRVQHGDWWAGKGVALARIQLPAGYLDFYNTHAHAKYGRPEYIAVLEDQMGELAKFVKASACPGSPALVVGDFNCRPDMKAYQIAVAEANLVRAMVVESRIDHIFHVDDPRYAFTVLETVPIDRSVRIGDRDEPLSDHTGYLSVIRIAPVPNEN